MRCTVFPPSARNEKAPARSLSGRTSAMNEACVKGGRVVNDTLLFEFGDMLLSRAASALPFSLNSAE